MIGGRADSPGGPSGDGSEQRHEELQSTVFDESFVRSAHLEEYSAHERGQEDAVPVRRVPVDPPLKPRKGGGRGGAALAALLLAAALAVLYFGTGRQSGGGTPLAAPPPASTVLPLQPDGPVVGGVPEVLYREAGAAEFGAGPAAVQPPDARRTERFSRDQVATGLELARRYVVASSLVPDVLHGGTAQPVRELLRPEQQRQLDRSLSGRSETVPVSTWLLRFESADVQLADEGVRTDTRFTVGESGQRLEITAHQVAAYALRPADRPHDAASLLLLQRDVLLAFHDQDLQEEQFHLVNVELTVGPVDCAESHTPHVQPLLADQRAEAKIAHVDPLAMDDERIRPCAPLSDS